MVPDGFRKYKFSKYISFFRMRFIAGLQYRAAALAGIATQFFWGVMNILLFRVFYQENSAAFPMTFRAFSSYIWLQQAFLALYMPWIFENEIFHTITDGGIAYELCRPIDIYNMWFVRNMANRLSKAVLRSMPILLFASFLPKPYGLCLPINLHAGFWFLITAFWGLLVVVAICMLVYIIAFFTISPTGIRMLLIGISQFLAGSVIPLPFLPDGIRKIVEFLPFASIQKVPLRVYSGDISGSEIYARAFIQLIWLLILVFCGKMLIRKAERRVTVQGG